jgi:ketosteroid isomerase-like protein
MLIRYRRVLLLAVLVVGGGPSMLAAQAPTTPQEEAEHEAIRGLRAAYEQAVRENRLDLLQPYLHPEFTGVMVTGRAVASLEEVRAYWRDIRALIGEGGSYTTTVKPEWSTLFGDVALARGTTEDVVVTAEGQEFRFESFWTAVLQKHEGRWTIRRVQGSMDPIANPFVREFARRAVVRSVIVSGLGGLVLGVLAMWIVGRRAPRARPASA